MASAANYKDPDGFDAYADTVGAGIYSGNVKKDANGNVLWGKQYQNHNPNPGPIYDGTGYTKMAKAIHTGDPKVVETLLKQDKDLVDEIMTGGARPLHTCGMSKKGQLVTQLIIDYGGDINAMDTYGYTPLHRMASNNLPIGAEALLKAGAKWDQKSGKPYSGETPMNIALQSSAYDVIKVLQKYGDKEEKNEI
eukprot:CAMPEP_0201574634 /NCGR_PEP_ID=MMETSP0190_2-20130828/19252_1 /ASSEMBLY_ACC=CAM_ASM_000263 /TAXON_ID=37353 /ORGANISM="Rosalina sp." /LENGTH=193 /DNA_ID=CAMNT_0048003151 /DNA_START=68 /DNA_END=649 /DNA_ORIENTATION=-